jgi:hypothetical protein
MIPLEPCLARSVRRLASLAPAAGLALAGLHARAVGDPPAADPVNRWQMGARLGFNLGVDFRNRALPLPDTLAPLVPGAVDRVYADGFVRPDASGSADGTSWNWGYADAAQVAPDGSALDLHGYSGTPYADSPDRSEEPQWGAEVSYARILGEWAGAHWGFEIGVQWTALAFEDDASLSGSMTRTTDAYPLQGVIPPAAPYAGSFDGPGPVIAIDSPARRTESVPTVVNGRRELEGNLVGLHLGPVLDLPLGDWLSAQLSGGLALAWVDAELAYDETATAGPGIAWSRSGSASDTSWLVGGYVRGQVTLRLGERFGIFGAAEFQTLTSDSVGDAEVEAEFAFDAGVFYSAGLRFDF